MRLLEMGLAFASLGFVVANFLLVLLTVSIWRLAGRRFRRAGALFLLRMVPAIGSLALVAGLAVPSFWAFEPRSAHERAGPVLVFVVLAGLLVGAGLRRAFVSWRQTMRLERAWKAAAVEASGLEIPVCAYRVPSDRPFAALVGIVRPKLFVSDRFLDVLSPSERRAVLDHEAGHLRSLDNLKRLAMRLAPDCLSAVAAGREIEAAWATAAEEEADDQAAGPGRLRSLDLAGALLKASRMMPLRCGPVSNFCNGATIAGRVERLLADRPARSGPAHRSNWRRAWMPALLVAAALAWGPSLTAAYELTEAAVRLLR
jgi:hypothetical protein